MPSLRKAINEKCKDCIYDKCSVGNWRVQVTLCTVVVCPLYEVRPKTKAVIPDSVLAGGCAGEKEAHGDSSKSRAGSDKQDSSDRLKANSPDIGSATESQNGGF